MSKYNDTKLLVDKLDQLLDNLHEKLQEKMFGDDMNKKDFDVLNDNYHSVQQLQEKISKNEEIDNDDLQKTLEIIKEYSPDLANEIQLMEDLKEIEDITLDDLDERLEEDLKEIEDITLDDFDEDKPGTFKSNLKNAAIGNEILLDDVVEDMENEELGDIRFLDGTLDVINNKLENLKKIKNLSPENEKDKSLLTNAKNILEKAQEELSQAEEPLELSEEVKELVEEYGTKEIKNSMNNYELSLDDDDILEDLPTKKELLQKQQSKNDKQQSKNEEQLNMSVDALTGYLKGEFSNLSNKKSLTFEEKRELENKVVEILKPAICKGDKDKEKILQEQVGSFVTDIMKEKNIGHKNKIKEYVKNFVDKITSISSLSKSKGDLEKFAKIRQSNKQLFTKIKNSLKQDTGKVTSNNAAMSEKKQQELKTNQGKGKG